MTPSKIFEYMSYGKPIISTAPISNEPCMKYLKTYPLSLVVDENNNSLDCNVEIVESFILNNCCKHCDSENLKEIYALNTPKAFYDTIRV